MSSVILDCVSAVVREEPSYHPLPGEPSEWHLRFSHYFLPLGAGRSLLAAYNAERAENPKKSEKIAANPKSNSVPTQWREASQHWSWWKRAADWDLEIASRSRAAYEKMLHERQRQVLEREWVSGNRLLDMADAVTERLEAFYQRSVKQHPDEKLPDGTILRRETVFIELQTRDALKALELGSRLTRQAIGLTTPQAQAACQSPAAKDTRTREEIDQEIEKMLDDLGVPRLPPNPAALRAPEGIS